LRVTCCLSWSDARVGPVFEALHMQEVPALLWNHRRRARERRGEGTGGGRQRAKGGMHGWRGAREETHRGPVGEG